jgi:hypothetical protein
MASIWEILDPSHLRYDTELGFRWEDLSRSGDLGSGPPSPRGGWIRSGYIANNSGFPSNCNAWTTTEGQGNFAELVFDKVLQR